MSHEIRENLTWAEDFSKIPEKARKKVVEQIFKELEKVSHQGEGSDDNRLGREMVKDLRQNYTLIGVSPGINYIRAVSSDKDLLKYFWVHPFGLGALVFKHKKRPKIVHVSPWVRLNKSLLGEMKENPGEKFGVEGVIG